MTTFVRLTKLANLNLKIHTRLYIKRVCDKLKLMTPGGLVNPSGLSLLDRSPKGHTHRSELLSSGSKNG